MAGVPGAVVANLANLLSPVILIVLATYFYTQFKNDQTVKGAFDKIQLAVFAMIIAVAFQTVNVQILAQTKNLLLVCVVFALFLYTKIHPGLIILGAGLLGALKLF